MDIDMTKQLKSPVTYNIVSGILLSIVVSCAILIDKYEGSLEETANKLQTVKANLSKMNMAGGDIDILLSKVKTMVPPDFYKKSAEEMLFLSLDDLKSRLADADIAITNIEDNGDLLTLPVTINAPLKNYADFVNDTGYLMGLKFPFFSITSITLSRKEENEGIMAVVYVINGKLEMPKK